MSATWFGVAVKVEIDFDSGPRVALGSCTFTDVTADVRAVVPMTVNRGTTSELSTISPSTFTLVLNNRDRTYDTSNTAGAYYGKLLPRRRIRVTLAGTPIFTGFTQAWLADYPEAGTDATVTVPCVCGFDVLSSASLPGSAYAAEVLADDPINYWPMQEAATSQTWADVVDPTGDLRRVAATPAEVQTASYPLGQPSMQLGNFRNPYTTSLTTPATMEMWVSTTADVSQLGEFIRAASSSDFMSIKPATGLNTTSGSLIAYVEFRYSHGGKTDSSAAGTVLLFPMPAGDVFHLAVTVDGTYGRVYVNGVLVATDTLAAGSWTYGNVSRASLYPYGEKAMSHVACYSTALSADRIAAHHEAGISAYGHPRGERGGARIGRMLDAGSWPTADRDLATGETVLDAWLPEGGDILSACREVETTDQGMFFMSAAGKATFRSRQDFMTTTRCAVSQATFGDDVATETPLQDPLRIDGASIDYLRNVVTVSYNGATATTSDATSVDAYGEAEDSVATLIPADGGFIARQLAAFRLRLRKDPMSRVPALTAQPHYLNNAATYVATLVGLELGDRVTVNLRPSGGSGTFSQECTIRGIRWTISGTQGFLWQAYLSPVVPSYIGGNYLTLADASYGLIGRAHSAHPGTSGSYLSTPDAAVLDITGDLELVACIRASSYTPAGGLDICAKWGGTQQSWQWSHMPAGTMRFRYSPDGTTTNSVTSTVAMSVTDGEYIWVKVTLDVDNGAGGRDVKFYTASGTYLDSPTWVQLGATVTTAGTTSIFSGTSVLAIGSASNGTGNMFSGSIYRLIVRNAIGSGGVFDYDAREILTHGQATVLDQSNGATITANGSCVLHPQNVIPY